MRSDSKSVDPHVFRYAEFFDFLVERLLKRKPIYLCHTKSSGHRIVIAYSLVKKKFFFYEMIERLSLYLSILNDHYSIDIIHTNSQVNLFLSKSSWYQQCILSFIHVVFSFFSLFFYSSFFHVLSLISLNN
jgi:hypothetical protein